MQRFPQLPSVFSEWPCLTLIWVDGKKRGARGANAAVSVFYVWAFRGFVEIAVNTCKCFLKLQLSPPGPGFHFFWMDSNSSRNVKWLPYKASADSSSSIRCDPDKLFKGEIRCIFKFSTYKRNTRWPGSLKTASRQTLFSFRLKWEYRRLDSHLETRRAWCN